MAAWASLDRTTRTPWTPTAGGVRRLRVPPAAGWTIRQFGGHVKSRGGEPGSGDRQSGLAAAAVRRARPSCLVQSPRIATGRLLRPASAGNPQCDRCTTARDLRSVARHPTKSRRPAGHRGVTSATELVSGGAPGTGAGRDGGGGACCPGCVRKSAATFVGEADSPFTMCISLPQTRQRGGHLSVPVTQYPQQEYVTGVPASASRRGPSS